MQNIRFTMSSLFTCLTISLTAVACDGSWDDEVAAPENFRSTYQQIHVCRGSQHPKAKFVITWLSPEGSSTWDALSNGDTSADFPVGTVAVKAQYSDASCSSLTGYTLMEKTSTAEDAPKGGWRWQFTNEFGECSDCDAGAGCTDCHTAVCTSSPKLFCTAPSP